MMSEKLTENNPDIADLSDMNRPTKIAERFTELYLNEWTEALTTLETPSEVSGIKILLKVTKVGNKTHSTMVH